MKIYLGLLEKEKWMPIEQHKSEIGYLAKHPELLEVAPEEHQWHIAQSIGNQAGNFNR